MRNFCLVSEAIPQQNLKAHGAAGTWRRWFWLTSGTKTRWRDLSIQAGGFLEFLEHVSELPSAHIEGRRRQQRVIAQREERECRSLVIVYCRCRVRAPLPWHWISRVDSMAVDESTLPSSSSTIGITTCSSGSGVSKYAMLQSPAAVLYWHSCILARAYYSIVNPPARITSSCIWRLTTSTTGRRTRPRIDASEQRYSPVSISIRKEKNVRDLQTRG